ncbi:MULTISPECIES: fasciclin domain-containing protein [unclassified Sphingomonas]|uniref:fasciclin domain-containing protein n=1 Tax=unclassified Sphingomonas TaxID=196159 RepID=UPI00285F5FF6|nr:MULTISPECIES: fasciclin domain-containing protein [unclassified Sphingomonas]MDR6115845.1 putative surface protein with fasciclin (FAS1) repeats [Sphingomonas sp. SORGH_AS_0789]MDR6150484.1 putative surface protein with fasciclin (FAS1) repeats [Sphingomonas sp. SORGH_AS_0742]
MTKTFAILMSATALVAAGTAATAQTAQTAPTATAPAQAPAQPAPATPAATGTVVQVLAATPDRSTLAKLVTTAGLAADLSGPGPFTVFAPSDEAFSRMPAGALDTLSQPANKAALTTILKYHVVSGKLTAEQLKQQIAAGNGTATLTTLAGQPLTAQLGPNGNVMLTDVNGQKAYVDKADVAATNGVVHLTNGISVPKIG